MQDAQPTSEDAKYLSSLNPEFGDARGFWKLYDDLANSKDRDLSKDLNGNLDTLLIFAGLFSAINTAFISFTMSDLSPVSLDKTNALLELLVLKTNDTTVTPSQLSLPFTPNPGSVVANCLLYASLCCSLFSAAGAMLGKEWLRHFDRKRQVASLGDQARYRQRKFRGIQKWHFQETILMLPYVLLLSVFLFFTGLVPYLLHVNRAVAGVVVAFLICGSISWGFTILSCILDPLSPYHTSLTFFVVTALKRDESPGASPPTSPIPQPASAVSRFSNKFHLAGHSWPSSPVDATHQMASQANARRESETSGKYAARSYPAAVATSMPGRLQRMQSLYSGTPHVDVHQANDKHALNAETVRWLLGATSKPEDLVVVAQNLC
ncbi:hypothetical protein FRB90_005774 [Tulasnella sp. 427]|nr:hypothetical protein FRB90_005774 [Tulasnella sp. 427]